MSPDTRRVQCPHCDHAFEIDPSNPPDACPSCGRPPTAEATGTEEPTDPPQDDAGGASDGEGILGRAWTWFKTPSSKLGLAARGLLVLFVIGLILTPFTPSDTADTGDGPTAPDGSSTDSGTTDGDGSSGYTIEKWNHSTDDPGYSKTTAISTEDVTTCDDDQDGAIDLVRGWLRYSGDQILTDRETWVTMTYHDATGDVVGSENITVFHPYASPGDRVPFSKFANGTYNDEATSVTVSALGGVAATEQNATFNVSLDQASGDIAFGSPEWNVTARNNDTRTLSNVDIHASVHDSAGDLLHVVELIPQSFGVLEPGETRYFEGSAFDCVDAADSYIIWAAGDYDSG